MAAIVRAVVGPTQQSYHHVVRATEEAQGERQKGGEDVRGQVPMRAWREQSRQEEVDGEREGVVPDADAL